TIRLVTKRDIEPRPNISVAKQIRGSLTGSQRPQAPGHARPRSAILTAAKRHIRPYRATSGDTSKGPPNQYDVSSSSTAGAAQRTNACSIFVDWEPNWEQSDPGAGPVVGREHGNPAMQASLTV